jgi:uncharacterized repeat protein (TIGR03803 family)
MNTLIEKHLTSAAFMALCVLMHTGTLPAQTFTNLYNFPASGIGSSPNPSASLTISGGTLYGTASFGGANGKGSVFMLDLNTLSFTNVYNFSTPGSTPAETETNSDGMWAYSNLILLGNSLYGITEQGGTGGAGTVFQVNTNGAGFAALCNLTNPPGDITVLLSAELIFTNNSFFGTAVYGGASKYGTVFTASTNGTGLKTLHNFTDGSDGANPIAGLIAGTNFFGVASSGGGSSNGTIFKVSTNGTGFVPLHSFTATSKSSPDNSDGARPNSLIVSGGTLYGTTSFGGSSANGTIFKINTDGTGFTNLYSFSASSGNTTLDGTNSDGASPSRLLLSGNTIYGEAYGGGQFGHGTIFSLATDGTDFTVLYAFSAGSGVFFNVTNNDGAYPIGGLILSDNTLYGTTSVGGAASFGTIFSFSLPPPPQLTMSLSGANLVLTWPTNASGFTLQSTTNLSSTAWGSNSVSPVIVNGLNTVTNPISGPQMFYRLTQ